MLDKGRIQELLGTGLSNEVVANAVGCDSAYIAQLMSDAEFSHSVVLARSAALTANSERDRRIDGIEDTLIDKLKEKIENDEIYKPQDIMRAFGMVNAARRRGVPAHANLTQTTTVVALILPAKLQKQFTLTQQAEVIAVSDVDENGDTTQQTLVTMPTHQLLQNLANKDQSSGERYKEVSKYLPTAAGKV